MQGIFEVLSASTTTMPIVHAKDLKLRPELCWNSRLFLRRLNHIKNDRDSVFIGFSYNSNICIGSKRFYHSEGFRAYLTCLEERKRAMRLVLLQKLCNVGLDALRGHLGLSTCAWDITLGLLGLHGSFHNDREGGTLFQILHKACR